jgi:YHS domain-containing protein
VRPASESPAAAAKVPERSAYTQSKYEQIASRKGATGLKGFCPVRLRDHRDLADGQPEYRVQHNGRVYALSSAEALKTFLADPEKYTPAASGYDIVLHQQTGDVVEGVLDHSSWFKGRLYMFTSEENKQTFVSNPTAYAVK